MTYTHIAVVLDRSGSMGSIREDMIGGLEAFFKSQEELPGDCLVDYAQFDTVYEKVYEDTPVSKAYVRLEPRGGTALLDALGSTINDLKSKFKNMPKKLRPDNIIVIVVTDGHENSSREFKKSDVKAMVENRTKKGWDFVFLGANMDAVAEAGSLGFNAGSSLTYSPGADGVTASSLAMSHYVTRTRLGQSTSFTDEERAAAAK